MKGRIMPVTFADVHETWSARYPDPPERWYQFERLIADGLRADRTGGDIGVDIVDQGAGGDYTASQCRCNDLAHDIAEGDLDSFLAMIQQDYVQRMVFTTAAKWRNNADQVLYKSEAS